MSEIRNAWHFLRPDWTAAYGTLGVLRPGQNLHHDGPLVLCQSGLHASMRAIDALRYAPGQVVTLVQCGGEVIEGDDKIVCRKRTIVWGYDATDELRLFARRCALSVAHVWDMPAVVREYLETGDEGKRDAAVDAAYAAAVDAAKAAALDPAWGAALDPARAAARAAAWAAARAASAAAAYAAASAAWSAADAAAAAAVYAAVDAAVDAALNPALDPARAAAWAAAVDAQNTELESILFAGAVNRGLVR